MGFFDSMNAAKDKESIKYANSKTELTWDQKSIQRQRGFDSTNDNELIDMYKNSSSRFNSKELEVIRITLFQRGYHLKNGNFVK